MKYRKKPVVIEAVQYTAQNPDAAIAFLGGASWHNEVGPIISTLEGEMQVSEGDWIIKGVHGEFYPCKPDIFAKTYEPVKGQEDD
jgi:hypothetical protein